MDPVVSIITPTFNHECFISQCIESVLAQGLPSWEQIVIDDGSTDRTPERIAQHRDARVRYVRQAHVGLDGLCDTYNRALGLCHAPLIAILEGDDYWPPDKLETLVPAFADPDVVLAYGQTVVVGPGRYDFAPTIPSPDFERRFPPGTLENTPVGRAAEAMLHYRGLVFTYPCSVIVRRSALEGIGGFRKYPGLVVTDHPTFLRLALEGRFHFARRPTGYWRVHSQGTTVRDMDRILGAVHREVADFEREHGARLGITRARWREIERSWSVAEAWMSLREARRLLVERRWRDARPHLWRAMSGGRWTTSATALAGLLGSRLHFSIEPICRMRGRAWFRLADSGGIEVVTGAWRGRYR